MKADNLPVDYQDWLSSLETPSPGRPHIADYLINKDLVKSRREAFARFLSEGRPYYLPRFNPPLERCIAAIHAAGGITVVAHPLSLRISNGRLFELLPQWREQGIDGIEVIHPTVNRQWYRRLEQAAAAVGLLASGGSDFHGAVGEQRYFGKTSWGSAIPAELSLIAKLEQYLRNLE
jgi:predicted metal-dependent phosphoesterase TrpH